MKRLFKFILLVINIAVAAALIFSGYGGHFNPATSTLPGIALMLFPIVLGAVLFILFFDLITWRRLAFLPALAILACAPAVWNFCPMNLSTHTLPEGYRSIKVLSYNVSNMRDYSNNDILPDSINPTVTAILATDADIVCLQESQVTDPSLWSNIPLQSDSITTRYPYRAHGHGTLSIWSKFPFDTLAMRQYPEASSMYQCARINIDGTPVTLYNVHLQSIGLSRDDKALYGSITRRPTTHKLENARSSMITKLSAAMRARALEAALLRQQIDSIGGSDIIVTGDFNDIEDCYAQRLIQGRTLRSAFTSAGFGPTVTYHDNRFYFNIDHILYGGRLKILEYERGRNRSSDHYSVCSTFALPVSTNAPTTANE